MGSPWGSQRSKVLSMRLWRSWLRREKDWRVQHVDPYEEHRQYRAMNRRHWRAMRRRRFTRLFIFPALAAATAMGLYAGATLWGPWADSKPNVRYLSPGSTTVFRRCADARAAGRAPIRRGQPGYAPHLDADNNGVACEFYWPW
jgi:hypothetical protein